MFFLSILFPLQISVAIHESRDITRLTVPPIKSLNELLTDDVDITGTNENYF
jgi:hypothetical protein